MHARGARGTRNPRLRGEFSVSRIALCLARGPLSPGICHVWSLRGTWHISVRRSQVRDLPHGSSELRSDGHADPRDKLRCATGLDKELDLPRLVDKCAHWIFSRHKRKHLGPITGLTGRRHVENGAFCPRRYCRRARGPLGSRVVRARADRAMFDGGHGVLVLSSRDSFGSLCSEAPGLSKGGSHRGVGVDGRDIGGVFSSGDALGTRA